MLSYKCVGEDGLVRKGFVFAKSLCSSQAICQPDEISFKQAFAERILERYGRSLFDYFKNYPEKELYFSPEDPFGIQKNYFN